METSPLQENPQPTPVLEKTTQEAIDRERLLNRKCWLRGPDILDPDQDPDELFSD